MTTENLLHYFNGFIESKKLKPEPILSDAPVLLQIPLVEKETLFTFKTKSILVINGEKLKGHEAFFDLLENLRDRKLKTIKTKKKKAALTFIIYLINFRGDILGYVKSMQQHLKISFVINCISLAPPDIKYTLLPGGNIKNAEKIKEKIISERFRFMDSQVGIESEAEALAQEFIHFFGVLHLVSEESPFLLPGYKIKI